MKNKVEEIVKVIKSLPKKRETLLIGIDGRGGAGKTTLALLVKQQIPEVIIITTDDFFSEEKKIIEWKELYNQVLEPLSNNKQAKYSEYLGGENGRRIRVVDPGGIVLIEGSNALRKDIADVYDYKIWIEVSLEDVNKRVTKRDGYFDEDWEKYHRPNENNYIQEDNPEKRADFIIDNNEFKHEISNLDEMWRSIQV